MYSAGMNSDLNYCLTMCSTHGRQWRQKVYYSLAQYDHKVSTAAFITVEYGDINAQQEQSFDMQQASHLLSDWGQENTSYQYNLLSTHIT